MGSQAAASEDPFGGTTSDQGRVKLASSTRTIKSLEGITGGPPELEFRDSAVVAEPVCAVEGPASDATGSTGYVPPLSNAEADRIAAETAAADQVFLDASTYRRESSKNKGKPAKAPTGRQHLSLGAASNIAYLQVDVDAVHQLLTDLLTAAEQIASGLPYSGNPSVEPECSAYYECGGERVDDVLFGGISDGPEGAYFDYVNQIGSIISDTSVTFAPFSTIVIDRDALATGVAESEFGDQPRGDHMPVFYYCRIGTGGEIELANPQFQPSFAWATTIEDQYDVPAARASSLETLLTTLNGHTPEIQTVPPIERGYTFVKLPMWLWLENIDDLDGFRIEAISEEGTVRLATRATLIDVTWQIGDATYECLPDDMEVFLHGEMAVTETPPPCTHRFFKLQDYTITATVNYAIEEQLTYRGADTYEWPDAPWTPHPQPQASITHETEQMTVHEIPVVNTVPGDN